MDEIPNALAAYQSEEAMGHTSERPDWQDAAANIIARIMDVVPTQDPVESAERLKFLEWMITAQCRYGMERNGAVPSILAHIGNYWCCGILLILQLGSLRPSAMLKILGAMEPTHRISQRMLTLNLRELERDGLIEREIYHSRRAHVEYRLTPGGKKLSEIIMGVIDFGTAEVPNILAARQTFDARAQDPASPYYIAENSPSRSDLRRA
jgi:DNA-binding HxlR family transcriptional regulator